MYKKNNQEEKRSPLKIGTLRDAGQSLTEKIYDKCDDDIINPSICLPLSSLIRRSSR